MANWTGITIKEKYLVMTPFSWKPKLYLVTPSYVILQLELNVSFMHPSPLSILNSFYF